MCMSKYGLLSHPCKPANHFNCWNKIKNATLKSDAIYNNVHSFLLSEKRNEHYDVSIDRIRCCLSFSLLQSAIRAPVDTEQYDLALHMHSMHFDMHLLLCDLIISIVCICDRVAKTGHMGTNYTLSFNRSCLSAGTEYFNSVTCII